MTAYTGLISLVAVVLVFQVGFLRDALKVPPDPAATPIAPVASRTPASTPANSPVGVRTPAATATILPSSLSDTPIPTRTTAAAPTTTRTPRVTPVAQHRPIILETIGSRWLNSLSTDQVQRLGWTLGADGNTLNNVGVSALPWRSYPVFLPAPKSPSTANYTVRVSLHRTRWDI